jgi:Inward rectifier potassium channel transmembrane domain
VHVAGYGNTGPNNCAWASLVLVIQTIFGLLLDAITIGVLFARISHPQQRARSVGCLCQQFELLALLLSQHAAA